MSRTRLVLLAACLASALAFAPSARAQFVEQPECTSGQCTGRRPQYSDSAWVSWIGKRLAIGTKEVSQPFDYALTIFDLDTGIPPLNTNWDPAAGLMRRYHGPVDGSGFGVWRTDTLGSIFGLTLDNRGNIYVTSTACYFTDVVSQLPGATSGSVLKIDRFTGRASVFANLPQAADPAYLPGNDMPALGNITYDPAHDVLFVTNMEDGKIYRLDMTGAITATFDPMGADNGLPGWAPLGERLWGIQWHADNHLYYSVWATDGRFFNATVFNTIRRVALDGSGFIQPATDVQILQVPHMSAVALYSHPVSDISFKPNGRMLLAERTMQNETYPMAHDSRLLEYVCNNPPGGWTPGASFSIGTYSSFTNSAGGTDASYDPYAGGVPGRVWVTGDALHLTANDYIYGAQGFPPTGGSIANSYLFDFDGNVTSVDKFTLGDIELTCPGDTGSVHGRKFQDLDCDGERDPGEGPLGGWTIVLSGPGGTFTAVTDAAGNFHFWNVPNGNYTVCELGQSGWTQTQPAGGCYNITVANNAILGLTFGNCQSCLNPAPCVKAPANMVAWWPLDELSGPTAHDIAGFNPGTWAGSPVPGPGKRGGALCFGQGQWVQVANSSQINFGSTADFSIDAWIKPATVTGLQVILDKRQLVGSNFQGYALAVQNGALVFTMNDGTNATITYVSSPVITAGAWNHVAVTVKRALNGGTAYLNGSPIGTFNPLATGAGSVTNSAPLYLARNQAGTQRFEGCLDEIELFCRELTAAEVMNLWSPGKCREWCSLPPTLNFGPFATTATLTFTICNRDWSQPSMTYSWSLAGLPAGPGCSVNGPTGYSPSSGFVTIPAGGCQNVTVTVTRPAWLTPGSTGCYVLNVTNTLTHACFDCTGKVTASKKWWIDVALDPLTLGNGSSGIARFTVHGDIPPGTSPVVNYKVYAEFADAAPGSDGSAPPTPGISLNGLPPGEPVLGTLSVVPGGGVIGVPIGWGGPCSVSKIPDTFVKVAVDDDPDAGLGLVDVAAMRLVLAEDGQVGIEPPVTSPRVEAVSVWPNPAVAGARVRLSLAQASDVDAAVYDLAGRVVRHLQRGRLAAGDHDLAWDGRDDGGRAVRAGMYFIRMRADDREYGARLVKIQ